MSLASSDTFLNLRQNSEHVHLVVSGTDRPQENGIFRFLKVHKNIAFSTNWKFFSQKIVA